VFHKFPETGRCSDFNAKPIENVNECRSVVSQIRRIDQRVTFREFNNPHYNNGCYFIGSSTIIWKNSTAGQYVPPRTHCTGCDSYQLCISTGA